jgi:hypothetical protein
VRVTISLDKDVYEAAVRLSRTSGKRLGRVLSELARRGIEMEPRDPPKRSQGQRFPTFDVAADAPISRASRVQRFIDKHGYL